MKKIFESPKMELILVEANDILTLSFFNLAGNEEEVDVWSKYNAYQD